MDWSEIAPMMVAIVLILTAGGVAILRPISKRLGELLEVMATQKRSPELDEDFQRMRRTLERMAERLERLEERQDFTDALMGDREPSRLSAPDGSEPRPARALRSGTPSSGG